MINDTGVPNAISDNELVDQRIFYDHQYRTLPELEDSKAEVDVQTKYAEKRFMGNEDARFINLRSHIYSAQNQIHTASINDSSQTTGHLDSEIIPDSTMV